MKVKLKVEVNNLTETRHLDPCTRVVPLDLKDLNSYEHNK